MALSGATYAASFTSLGFVSTNPGPRDEIRNEDLQRFYQDINRASFGGNLPDVPVRWGDLTEADAYGITRFDHGVPYAMELDRETVRSASFALDVIRHESCHIATNGEAKRRGEDPHGATFVACMARIQEDETGD
jgi:hypothetical protein